MQIINIEIFKNIEIILFYFIYKYLGNPPISNNSENKNIDKANIDHLSTVIQQYSL